MQTPAPSLSVHEFQARWRSSSLSERASAQPHFTDICRLVGHPAPNEADPEGRFFAFEHGVGKLDGGRGFADVWYRDRFGWEYKRPNGDLEAAYRQLLLYREDLDNPPLLVTSDLRRIEIHTNFTRAPKKVHKLHLDTLDRPDQFGMLRAAFFDPDQLHPRVTVERVTEEAAARFAALAASLHARGIAPARASHFLVQLLFCLFAEDVRLLPAGVFSRLAAYGAKRPDGFAEEVGRLFGAMRDGGTYALEDIPRFNGGLFRMVDPIPLTGDELARLAEAARLDWGSVEPAIFGTLFERSLDPSQRAQLGAHYTGREDIERVVEPVVLAPLRRRWAEVRARAAELKAAWDAAPNRTERTKRRDAFAAHLFAFQEEIAGVRVLDPACGSGNFLYVVLAALLDLEKEVVAYGATSGLPVMQPRVAAAQVAGLEVNPYARELAQVVVWIGYLQWMIGNGFTGLREPILEPLETIKLQDALIDRSDPASPKEAAWPTADYIVGNPPFLGGKLLRTELGDAYVGDLFAAYQGDVARESDLACYFFERARQQISGGEAKRTGLLATNSIRGGANRKTLERIKASGDIFLAWDDEPWILNGAAVRISIVGFDDGSETERCLDGEAVATINADLTGSMDITASARLAENAGLAYMGDTKGGSFDIPGDLARRWLALPLNPNGRPNSDVVRPWVNGLDVTRRPRGMWIVDFGTNMPEPEAALYEAPFEYVRQHVKPKRDKNNREAYRRRWWLHVEPRSGMRGTLLPLGRFIVTPTVAKHRLFTWSDGTALPDHQLIVFARADDWFFGVLHSRAHEVWSLRLGTWLGVGNDPRYTPTTCFETFPLPWPPGEEPADDLRVQAVAAAARALDENRRRWLDPESETDPAVLKERTLTRLYNARPAWLTNLHAALDRAVWAAYGWEGDPTETDDETILARLLELNRARVLLPPYRPSRPKGRIEGAEKRPGG